MACHHCLPLGAAVSAGRVPGAPSAGRPAPGDHQRQQASAAPGRPAKRRGGGELPIEPELVRPWRRPPSGPGARRLCWRAGPRSGWSCAPRDRAWPRARAGRGGLAGAARITTNPRAASMADKRSGPDQPSHSSRLLGAMATRPYESEGRFLGGRPWPVAARQSAHKFTSDDLLGRSPRRLYPALRSPPQTLPRAGFVCGTTPEALGFPEITRADGTELGRRIRAPLRPLCGWSARDSIMSRTREALGVCSWSIHPGTPNKPSQDRYVRPFLLLLCARFHCR